MAEATESQVARAGSLQSEFEMGGVRGGGGLTTTSHMVPEYSAILRTATRPNGVANSRNHHTPVPVGRRPQTSNGAVRTYYLAGLSPPILSHDFAVPAYNQTGPWRRTTSITYQALSSRRLHQRTSTRRVFPAQDVRSPEDVDCRRSSTGRIGQSAPRRTTTRQTSPQEGAKERPDSGPTGSSGFRQRDHPVTRHCLTFSCNTATGEPHIPSTSWRFVASENQRCWVNADAHHGDKPRSSNSANASGAASVRREQTRVHYGLSMSRASNELRVSTRSVIPSRTSPHHTQLRRPSGNATHKVPRPSTPGQLRTRPPHRLTTTNTTLWYYQRFHHSDR